MPLRSATIAIMGIPVRFSSDDEDLLSAVLSTFEIWSGSPCSGTLREVEVRASVLGSDPRVQGDPFIEVDDGLLRMVGPGVRAEADAVGEFAEFAVTPEFIGDPGRLASEVLDPIVLFLLTRRGRVPVHAAGLVDGDLAIVLAGPSGVGKSTLALAGVEDGLKLLSDDAVYVQTRPVFRLWGYPRPIRLLHGQGKSLPMRRRGDQSQKSGRWKASVHVRPEEVTTHAERAVLCLLSRRGSGERRRIEPENAIARSMSSLASEFDHFRTELPYALRLLVGGGAWEIDLSRESEQNLDLIREVAEEAAGELTPRAW